MQPDFELRLHPMDLREFGLIPSGRAKDKAKHRVVWADSRRSKVVHLGKRHELPRYLSPEIKGKWVLEVWKPSEEINDMPKELWMRLKASMPSGAFEEYPEHGDYEYDGMAFAGVVDQDLVKAIIRAKVHIVMVNSEAEVKLQHEALEESKKAKRFDEFEVIYEEAREESLCQA